MTEEDKIYWNALHARLDIGITLFRSLQKVFSSSREAYRGLSKTKSNIPLTRYQREQIARMKDEDPVTLYDHLIQEKVHIIGIDDTEYPKALKEIPSPPPFLYVRGNIDVLQQHSIAIVGSRKATAYGRSVTRNLVSELVAHDFVITSGLAFGIDSVAHSSTVEFDKPTIAVLGSGVESDSVYPRSNSRLAESITERGVILSEHSVGTKPWPSHFPRRNRIISGLSQGVVVVEAAQKSGALITAYAALDQNREVFAIPGDITRALSRGTNTLIQKGAKLVTSADDILEELHVDIQRNSRPTEKMATMILDTIQQGPTTFDKLQKETGFPQKVLQKNLTELELSGKLTKQMGLYYII